MSGFAPGLAVDSATGIEVSLPIAGPGARSFAYLIDWHIKIVLALAWYVVAAIIFNGRLSLVAPLHSGPRWFALVVLPALLLYFLYHLVLEPLMRGRTPGKRAVGIRVVARNGGAPGLGALLVRNVFRLVDSLPGMYALGLTLMVVTRDSVRCGDMAAGTLVVYEQPPTELEPPPQLPVTGGTLDTRGAELITELLQRWNELTPAARMQLADRLLAR